MSACFEAIWALKVHLLAFLQQSIVVCPIGIMLGIALGPFRVSGVDFRQWFKDPAQPNIIDDNTWMGLVGGVANITTGVMMVMIFFAAVVFWWPSYQEFDASLDGVLHFVGAILLCWLHWQYLFGIAVGVIISQFVLARVWRLGLICVPNPTATKRVLSVAEPKALKRPESELSIQKDLVSSNNETKVPEQPKKPARRIIICCDGTWNWPDAQRETNIIRLVRAIKSVAENGTHQIVFYHQGVGTGNIIDRIAGGGAGVGLSNSVKACYGFLVDNYQDGDEISLFGFSRGAYVARSIGGVIGKVGILKKIQMEHFAEIWDLYVSPNDPEVDQKLDELAKDRYPSVSVQCIGVWDTVGALGIPGTRFCAKEFTFHNTQLGKTVKHAFQALAIDERRGNFQPAVFVPSEEAPIGQVLEQVWFPGVHSNVGGGYEAHGLSDTTFLWMMALIKNWGLLDLDEENIKASLDPSEFYPAGKLQNSRTFGWWLLGSPVPRPIGITSKFEKIHESAWLRGAVSPEIKWRKDIYNRDRRKAWLDKMQGLKVERTEFERKMMNEPRRKSDKQHQLYSKKLHFCDKLMRLIGGNG